MTCYHCDTYLRSTILRWKFLNRPLYHLKNLPMMAGAFRHLKTPPFSISNQFLHFRSDSQIFDTGFSRLFPFSIFPFHHPPLALRARFQSPRSRSALARDPSSRVKIRASLALEKPVEEAGKKIL